jgi:myo-inositol-1(or 4)-monophosphatase
MRGAGGDVTVELDQRAEADAIAVLEEAAGAGAQFTLLSEEIGLRDYGAEFPRVILDPIDGSLNAKQGIPVFSVMLSLADGDRVDAVRVAHVSNLVSGQAWDAIAGRGAWLDGSRLSVLKSEPSEKIECLGLESSPRSLFKARELVERASKIRVLGSMALSLCHTAAGGLDVFCCPIRGRVFDMSASLLILRESGGVATDLDGNALDELPLHLESRTTLLAASNPQVHQVALSVMTRAEFARR